MNKKKNETYLDWLHRLRKKKSKLSLTERLSCCPELSKNLRSSLKKAA